MKLCDVGRPDKGTERHGRLPGSQCRLPAAAKLVGLDVCVRHRRALQAKGPEWMAHAELEWLWAVGHGRDPREYVA